MLNILFLLVTCIALAGAIPSGQVVVQGGGGETIPGQTIPGQTISIPGQVFTVSGLTISIPGQKIVNPGQTMPGVTVAGATGVTATSDSASPSSTGKKSGAETLSFDSRRLSYTLATLGGVLVALG
ncbi:hypothetical protein FB45DRAFT_255683 [Roridomyces roridus]|uniref:Uncharacterized protein n=1 Tax=Roridomyces roridus TaxID=1738132 RepID=A0AAD7FBV2_9AGAR|nr:hypothetical protein FB45DRAFT_255683 [Roridomyces roridus]